MKPDSNTPRVCIKRSLRNNVEHLEITIQKSPVRLRDGVEYSPIDDKERCSYYGGASVPFTWESRPGTPKHNLFSDSSLPPPLTPPPSYYSSGILSTPKRQSQVRTKLSKLLSMSMFNDLRKSSDISKKTSNNVYGSSFSWSSTSSSSSLSSPPHTPRIPVSYERNSMYAKREEDELRSPTSTLCWSNGGRKGFSSSMKSMKRALS